MDTHSLICVKTTAQLLEAISLLDARWKELEEVYEDEAEESAVCFRDYVENSHITQECRAIIRDRSILTAELERRGC